MPENGNTPAREVLVVDDDPALGRLLKVILITAGFSVRVAENGARALDMVRERAPDIVVLDLQMPVMDGRDFYREFRLLGHAAPVVILSAYNAAAARDELGADAALNKPFDPEALVTEASRLIAVAADNG
jgi:CheY-like chemotaxis protein